MNYHLELRLRAEADKAKVSRSSFDPEPIRQWSHNNPQFETWYIKAVRRPSVYDIRNQDDTWNLPAVKAICRETTSETGRACKVGFYGPGRQDPYILDIMGAPASAGGPVLVLPTIGAWFRRAARTLGRYWAEWQEDWPARVVGNAVQNEDLWGNGRIVRVYESTAMRANEADLIDTDLSTSANTVSDQGAVLLAGAWDAGQRYLMLEIVPDEGDTYEAGFEQGNIDGEAGYGYEPVPPTPFDLGYNAFLLEYPYDPFAEYPYPAPPDGYSDDWQAGWTDGHLSGWINGYAQGWVNAGGELP